MRIAPWILLFACVVSGCTTRQDLPNHLAPFVRDAPADAYLLWIPTGPGKMTYRMIWKGERSRHVAKEAAEVVAEVARAHDRLPGSTDIMASAWNSIVYIVSVDPLVWLHFDGPFQYEYPETFAVVAGISAGTTLVGSGEITLWMPTQDVYGAPVRFDSDGEARLAPSNLVLGRLGGDRFQVSLRVRSDP